ncbi:hypothetical protein EON81_01240 [bacterium]|nr:MAG: hypothetical protein EON81_01240 [bacterium]
MVITKDAELAEAARRGFHPEDEMLAFEDWKEALNASGDADLVFVDLVATLRESHKIAGYEEFARGKMDHPLAAKIPLVLIAPPPDYELDFLSGWPGFVFGHVQRPIDYRAFRRASTWV